MLTTSMQSVDVPRGGPSDRQSVLACLAEFKRSRGAEFDLQMLGVFGSVARGEAGQDSDIDVVFRTGTPNLFATVRMKQTLETMLGRPVDVVRLREAMNPRLKFCIERDALYV